MAGVQEVWAPVAGREGIYSVSNLGRVRSEVRKVRMGNGFALHTVGGRILKPWSLKAGYQLVTLGSGTRKCHKLVHRLVLEAFVGAAPDGMECCHLDDNKTNNRLENLRWDTRSANQYDCIANGNHPKINIEMCPQGHPYDAENTYYRPQKDPRRTARGCRKCRRRVAAESKARKAARELL